MRKSVALLPILKIQPAGEPVSSAFKHSTMLKPVVRGYVALVGAGYFLQSLVVKQQPLILFITKHLSDVFGHLQWMLSKSGVARLAVCNTSVRMPACSSIVPADDM